MRALKTACLLLISATAVDCAATAHYYSLFTDVNTTDNGFTSTPREADMSSENSDPT